MEQDIKIEVKDLCKMYEGQQVLKNISFEVKKGEFLAVLGLSGCGKTTLLRILIGLEKQDSGTIQKDGQEISVYVTDGQIKARIIAVEDGWKR